jgi:predicted Zn-ribbon and HTH transcriptional regulator
LTLCYLYYTIMSKIAEWRCPMEQTHVIQELKCLRCGHEWVPRGSKLTMCPRCKSRLWMLPPGEKRKSPARPKKKSK